MCPQKNPGPAAGLSSSCIFLARAQHSTASFPVYRLEHQMHAHNSDRTPANIYKTVSAIDADTVCGSLDPPGRSKETAKSGWRYIQCTDTQDELRVLLPPRPAAIYANLLKVEAHALAKGDSDSQRDLQYYRQLKDAMVKRCLKLVQDTTRANSDTRGSYPATIVRAPLEFKLRRLEQWWEYMEATGKTKGRYGRSKHKAHADGSRMQATPSTATISPNTKHARAVATTQAPVIHGTVVGQPQYDSNTQASPAGRRKRPAPLTVPDAGRTISAQSSPSVQHAPPSPNRSSRRASTHIMSSQSPQVQSPYQQSARQRGPVYTNNQMVSPLETPHNPYFDPNQSLAGQQYHPSPAGSRNGILADAHTSSVTVRSEVIVSPFPNDPRMNTQHVYSSADALAEPTSAQANPSRLKSRFHATYASTPSNSSSSPSSNASKPSAYAQEFVAHSQNGGAVHAGSGHTAHTRTHTSYSMPMPNTTRPLLSEQDHRRRATVDCSDTDRSVPRPKGYMYQSPTIYNQGHDCASDLQYNEQYYNGAQQASKDHSPSGLRQVAQVLNRSLASAGSPRSSPVSQGSPHSRGSPGARHSLEGSPYSQSSPGKAARTYGATLTAEPVHFYSNSGMSNGSPNLLPPAPAISRSRKNSNEVGIGVPSNGENMQPKQQLRRTTSRRVLRDRSPAGADMTGSHAQPVVPPVEYYTTQAKSPRRATIPPPDVQQPIAGGTYTRGRTRRGERSPRRRYEYDVSPRRGEAVIPDMAALTSNRNSRYTSGGSSVSEPVIPDVSLIMEAERTRNKGDRVRRRLVPLQSSSEEGGSRYASEFDESEISQSEDGDDDDIEADYYRPPYRVRDGYGSGYASEAEGGKSRPASRPPSRSPSRGILKRPSSVCSQRSSKSVRLEIPRDRRALEEVRDAEEKVDRAQKELDDLQRRRGSRATATDPVIQKATETFDQAKQSLKGKEEEYQAILQAMRLKRAEQEGAEPRYV